MNINHHILLKLIYPALLMGFVLSTHAYAVEQSVTDKTKLNSMPPAPVGPYRSTHGASGSMLAPAFDKRQWTPPSLPYWLQQQHRQIPIQQPVPSAWVPQQRRQIPIQQPVPPAWVQQQRRHVPMQPPAPPAWVQQQHWQAPVQRAVPPPWVQQQRRQMPPGYARPPARSYPPYPLYRH